MNKISDRIGEQIAEILREKIYCGHLKDGDELNQEEISNLYGVSRMPVRDALKELESECLASKESNHRTKVIGVTNESLASRFSVLSAIESEALILLPKDCLERLHQSFDKDSGEKTEQSEYDQFTFHSMVFCSCPDRFLQSLYYKIFRFYLKKALKEYSALADSSYLKDAVNAARSGDRETVHKCFLEYYNQYKQFLTAREQRGQ